MNNVHHACSEGHQQTPQHQLQVHQHSQMISHQQTSHHQFHQQGQMISCQQTALHQVHQQSQIISHPRTPHQVQQQQSHHQGHIKSYQQGHQHFKPKLKELCRYSEAISSCWKDLALELDLPQETINTIDNDHSRSKDKCYHMFNAWLERSPDPCWFEIVEAFKMIKLLQVAKEIEQAYLGKLLLNLEEVEHSCIQY